MKRSKQKSNQSPKLGPSPRMRANSVTSLLSSPSHTPEMHPNPMSLEPTHMSLSQPTYVQSSATSFRTLSSADGSDQRKLPALIPPRTGLGILMSSSSNGSAPSAAQIARVPQQQIQQTQVQIAPNPYLSAEQHQLMQQDMIDRERQASALASAGRIAERVDSTPLSGPINPTPLDNNMDFLHLDSGLNQTVLSDADIAQMDTDFSRLFDPENEIQNMETEGSGWPSTGTGNS